MSDEGAGVMKSGDGFGIDYFAYRNHCQRLFQGDPLNLYHLIEIELTGGWCKVARQK